MTVIYQTPTPFSIPAAIRVASVAAAGDYRGLILVVLGAATAAAVFLFWARKRWAWSLKE